MQVKLTQLSNSEFEVIQLNTDMPLGKMVINENKCHFAWYNELFTFNRGDLAWLTEAEIELSVWLTERESYCDGCHMLESECYCEEIAIEAARHGDITRMKIMGYTSQTIESVLVRED